MKGTSPSPRTHAVANRRAPRRSARRSSRSASKRRKSAPLGMCMAYDMVATSMRVLLVTPLFFPSLSGAAVYFDTLSQMLIRVAPTARVTILTRAVAGAPRRERRGAVCVLRLLPAARARRTRLGERSAALATVVVMLLVSLALHSDVVHYHTLVSYRAIHRLARLFRAPLVGDMRDLAARHEGAD